MIDTPSGDDSTESPIMKTSASARGEEFLVVRVAWPSARDAELLSSRGKPRVPAAV